MDLQLSKFEFIQSKLQLLSLILLVSASWILGWVGWLTWNDISVWNKDIGTIFLGSRTGESISLGIGMALVHYFLIGASLFAAGIVLFLRNRIIAPIQPQQAMMMKAQRIKTNNPTNSLKQKATSATKEENAVTREERFFSGCLHHFGYLSSRPKESPIPQECILCQRLGDCMVATVYVKKVNE
jgi:hypothetical protein